MAQGPGLLRENQAGVDVAYSPTMRSSLLLVLSTSLVVACGGKSLNDGAGGSGAQAGSGGVGATAGSGGAGATAGSGGVGATAGSGGSAGNECSADLKAKATLGGPDVGFGALPGSPNGAVVMNVSPSAIELSLGPGGSPLLFKWAGPDLSGKFKKGEYVGFGEQNGWSYVSGDAWTAVAYRDFGFVAPESIPEIPYYGPHLSYAPECTFMESSGACGQPPSAVTLLAVEATTGAGVVSIGQGQTGELVGWTDLQRQQRPVPRLQQRRLRARSRLRQRDHRRRPRSRHGGIRELSRYDTCQRTVGHSTRVPAPTLLPGWQSAMVPSGSATT